MSDGRFSAVREWFGEALDISRTIIAYVAVLGLAIHRALNGDLITGYVLLLVVVLVGLIFCYFVVMDWGTRDP